MPRVTSTSSCLTLGLALSVFAISCAQSQELPPGRASSRSLGAEIIANVLAAGETIAGGSPATITGQRADPQSASSDTQINDPTLDHIQDFNVTSRRRPAPLLGPWEFSTQSETSIAYNGNDIVTGYNSSAGIIRNSTNRGFTQLFLSGYSVSHDGGSTWRSSFIPPPAGGCTLGDPTVGVDRNGNYYFAHLACDARRHTLIAVSKSTDRGNTFGASTIAYTSAGADKPWLAVGPDPTVPTRDNLYVAWVNFARNGSSRLMLSTSLDGGATWNTQTVYRPANALPLTSLVQFPNPVVDTSNGRLYIPFLHYGNADADYIQVLVSNDAGATFSSLKFNFPGAPDQFSYPVVQPGVLNACGIIGGVFRLALFQGPPQLPPQQINNYTYNFYKYVTRIITQPAAVVHNNHLLIAFNSSTSATSGDTTAGSEIDMIASNDGGVTWSPPLRVAPSTSTDLHHVHPSIAMHPSSPKAFIGYYVQQSNVVSDTEMGQLRTDLTEVDLSGGENQQWVLGGTTHLSTTSFNLPPTNVRMSGDNIRSFYSLNYDQEIVPCYSIGEYMSVMSYKNGVIAAWGDDRNPWTPPRDSIDTSIHSQADVFSRFLVPGETDIAGGDAQGNGNN